MTAENLDMMMVELSVALLGRKSADWWVRTMAGSMAVMSDLMMAEKWAH